MVQAQAAGLDVHGLNSNPLFVSAPTASSYWTDTLQTTSPAVDTGHATLSRTVDRNPTPRTVPNIGAHE